MMEQMRAQTLKSQRDLANIPYLIPRPHTPISHTHYFEKCRPIIMYSIQIIFSSAMLVEAGRYAINTRNINKVILIIKSQLEIFPY